MTNPVALLKSVLTEADMSIQVCLARTVKHRLKPFTQLKRNQKKIQFMFLFQIIVCCLVNNAYYLQRPGEVRSSWVIQAGSLCCGYGEMGPVQMLRCLNVAGIPKDNGK